jgi:hypothetical protein
MRIACSTPSGMYLLIPLRPPQWCCISVSLAIIHYCKLGYTILYIRCSQYLILPIVAAETRLFSVALSKPAARRSITLVLRPADDAQLRPDNRVSASAVILL